VNSLLPRFQISLGQFVLVYTVFALLISAALLAPEMSPNPDRYRTIYTIWSTFILLAPAFCLYLFSSLNNAIRGYWRLFWTFSYLAYLFHFYWAVFVIFGGIAETFTGQGPLIASVNFVLTLWWGIDVVLSWTITNEPTWLRIERALVHVFVLLVFVITALLLRPKPITKFLGMLTLVSVGFSLLIWIIGWEPRGIGQREPLSSNDDRTGQ
jgi:hypothetical protein